MVNNGQGVITGAAMAQQMTQPYPSYVRPVKETDIEKEDAEQHSAPIPFLVRAGIMTASKSSTAEPPRLNPTVITLAAFLLVAVTALVGIGIAWGSQSGRMEFYLWRIDGLEKKLDEQKKESSKEIDLLKIDIQDLKQDINKLEVNQKRR